MKIEKIHCMKCGAEINVNVPDPLKIEDVDLFFDWNSMAEGDKQYTCSKCQAEHVVSFENDPHWG